MGRRELIGKWSGRVNRADELLRCPAGAEVCRSERVRVVRRNYAASLAASLWPRIRTVC